MANIKSAQFMISSEIVVVADLEVPADFTEYPSAAKIVSAVQLRISLYLQTKSKFKVVILELNHILKVKAF
jgi:hypothetical protein